MIALWLLIQRKPNPRLGPGHMCLPLLWTTKTSIARAKYGSLLSNGWHSMASRESRAVGHEQLQERAVTLSAIMMNYLAMSQLMPSSLQVEPQVDPLSSSNVFSVFSGACFWSFAFSYCCTTPRGRPVAADALLVSGSTSSSVASFGLMTMVTFATALAEDCESNKDYNWRGDKFGV
jgi:hypothetical protein